MKRREFVQKSALATAGALAAPSLLAASPMEKIEEYGVQLYTVRDVLEKDFGGTLKSLRKIGYDYCETFGFNGTTVLGKSISETKALHKKAKLPIKSVHIMPDVMRGDWQQAVDNARELGAEYIVVAYILPDDRKKLDQYKELADLINTSAEISKKSGLQFLYHNHEFEFETLEGEVPYELLLKSTDAYYVKMELDLYWVRYADRDPLALFREYGKRFPTWHVKDMELADTRVMTEVGAGRIDWKQLFSHAYDSGLQHFFVEQDRNWAVDPVASTATSYKHLKGLRY